MTSHHDESVSSKSSSVKDEFRKMWEIDPYEISRDGHPAKWRLYYARGMIFWAFLSHVFLLLQAIKIYSDKDARGVSIPAYSIYIFGALVWLVYGAFVLAKRNWPVIVSAVFAFLLGVIVLTGAIIYQSGPGDEPCPPCV